jgi:hypothetical protein
VSIETQNIQTGGTWLPFPSAVRSGQRPPAYLLAATRQNTLPSDVIVSTSAFLTRYGPGPTCTKFDKVCADYLSPCKLRASSITSN